MLKFRYVRDQSMDVGDVLAQRVRGDLTMQNLHRDVGMIRRNLPPTADAVLGGDFHHTDELRAKCFNGGYFHGVEMRE